MRLPTAEEWEYVAKGWSEGKTGSYIKTLEATYAFCDVDREQYFHGVSELARLEVNPIGLYGMLGNAHEWCSERNTLCHWDDYFANYDNAIYYQVKTSTAPETDRYGFRVVLSSGCELGRTP
ncbi:SUMF1/EgtB/PvdO family nonheme iron enzyme [Armatimonas rosea]|uniref:Formylglycine-generating enzyme required for sulfatase activity n=1 Tax=Armatimonas rosea TaxID=685828 RepID=A0A7W9SUC0_ARMRO|nr:formylglycine-generating enzyme required for sulfatase activity [Armatimonas rosea]